MCNSALPVLRLINSQATRSPFLVRHQRVSPHYQREGDKPRTAHTKSKSFSAANNAQEDYNLES